MSAAENLKPRRAQPARLAPAESKRRIFFYTAALGTSVDEVTSEGFWLPVSRYLQAQDRIEIVEEGGAYFVELIVRSTSPAGAFVVPLRGVELGGLGARDTSKLDSSAYAGHSVAYRGPHLKWSVLRGEEVLKEELPSEDDARRWLSAHLQGMKR